MRKFRPVILSSCEWNHSAEGRFGLNVGANHFKIQRENVGYINLSTGGEQIPEQLVYTGNMKSQSSMKEAPSFFIGCSGM